MITANELNGVLAMMPAFATPNAIEISATETIAVDNLKEGVDRIVRDGINNIATTGTYGECYNLLWEEFRTLAAATVDAVNKRVPLFIGCTSPNPREVVQKMNFVRILQQTVFSLEFLTMKHCMCKTQSSSTMRSRICFPG